MTDAIAMADLQIHNSPDVRDWPATATITRLVFSADGVNVDFDREHGVDRWPDVTPPEWTGPIQFTLWLALFIEGVWHASGVIEYWHGRTSDGGRLTPQQVADNWFYDTTRWGPLAQHVVAVDARVGFFVTAGDARGRDVHALAERSNIVVVPFPPFEGATHTFPADAPPAPTPAPAPEDPFDLARLFTLGAQIADAVVKNTEATLEQNRRIAELQAQGIRVHL